MEEAKEDRLTALYNLSVVMSEADEAVKDKHEDDYKAIINDVKSKNNKERIMAAQLIARFFKYFPAHEESAFDSIVDLCESVDVDVRKHAAMAMITICRDCKHLVSKAADILLQLYQTNQPSEVNLINQSLTTLLNLDVQKFLQSFFTNFEDGTELVRERALKFLSTKIHLVSESSLTKEVEEQLLSYSKKAMEDVTKDEFITFVGILTKLKIAKTATGQAMIVLVIKSQAELDKEFNVDDKDTLDKFLLCTKHTIPLLSQYNRASEYINYICTKILPHLNSLSPIGNDLNVLQTLAEMSPFIHLDDIPKLIDLTKCQEVVYAKMLEYLPLPQTQQEPEVKAVEDKDEEGEVKTDPKQECVATEQEAKPPTSNSTSNSKVQEVDFQFTHIEYLIFTFHQFGRLAPEFLNETRQNELKIRLQNLCVGCTKYSGLLGAQLKNVKSEQDLNKEENKIRSVALLTTKNITVLIRDFLRKPPHFKTVVSLSCKPQPIRQPEPDTSLVDNNNGKPSYTKSYQNRGNYGKPNFNRQGGQKNKYKQNYNQNDRNKKPRFAR